MLAARDAALYPANSRYCEVDRLSNIAVELFGHRSRGWSRVQAICGWVNWKVEFGYHHARSCLKPRWTCSPSAREYAAISSIWRSLFCRALNIPAVRHWISGRHRYAQQPTPMDFSACFGSICKTVGGPSMPATSSRGSMGVDGGTDVMRLTLRSRRRSELRI